MIIDSHCHLDFPELAKQREAVLSRARAAGVGLMLTVGTTMKGFAEVRRIAAETPDVYASLGVHPHYADDDGERVTAAELIPLTVDPKVIAIGETGLDYFYDHAPRDAQQARFREHIRAAIGSGLPLIIHTRDAPEDTLRILREEGAAGGKFKAVMHCFSGGRALAEEALALGCYVSFSGILTFKKLDELRTIARDIPLDRLLVETDSPYLAPVPYRGKPCEPAYVVETAKVLADVKGVSFDEIAERTTANFYRLFAKVPKS